MTLNKEDLIKNYVWFGGMKRNGHPSTKDWWLDVVEGKVLLDIDMIAERMEEIKKKIDGYLKKGEDVLILSDKQMLMEDLEKINGKKNIHYLNYNIPAGFLTNFDTFGKRIESLNDMYKFKETEDYENLTKKEKVVYERRLKRVEKIYGGVRNLNKLPSFVVVVDGFMLEGVVDEVLNLKLDNVVVSGINLRREMPEENKLIVNINSYMSLKYILDYLLN